MKIDHLLGNPVSVKVVERIEENPTTVTLCFEVSSLDPQALPGSFLMVWVPDVDEIPMSICQYDPPSLGITVKYVGEATKALSQRNIGDWIGIRGPFGRPFNLKAEHALVVGGGVGVPPLRFLTDMLLVGDIKTTLVIAAKTKDELILYDFLNRKDSNLTIEIATDDGSMGFKGVATECAKNLLETNDFDMIYACGPELMMAGLHKIAKEQRISFQASLERYMKCGCGICGTCALDPTGDLVCIDGPVFS